MQHSKYGALQMTRATDSLLEDHNLILRMLRILNQSINHFEKDEYFSFKIFDKAIDFIHLFIDKFHHGKEEEILFKLIDENGCSNENDLIKILSKEHNLGRHYIAKFEAAVIRFSQGDESARADIIENGRNLSVLLSHHIHKENTILYELVNQTLSEADQQYLLSAFEKMKEESGISAYEKYLDMVEELEKESIISYYGSHQEDRMRMYAM